MKIGLIVHSKTGNTESVAKRLKDSYAAKGYDVTLEKMAALNDQEPDIGKIKFEYLPKIESYDLLILGAPVWAFSLSPVMKAYIDKVQSFNGQKIGLFVTQQLSLRFLGGNRSIRQFEQACQSKGGKVAFTGIINWSNKKRAEQIDALINDFNKI